MASVADPRNFTLEYLFKKCGFRFDESTDLSPDTRRRIGDLSLGVKGFWDLDSQMAAKRIAATKGSPAANGLSALGTLIFVGVIINYVAGFVDIGDPTGFIVFGVVLLALGTLVSRLGKRSMAKAVAVLQKKRDETYQVWATKADSLSSKILEESTAAYQQKVNPKVLEVKVDFAEIMRAAQGKGVILDKVKCPSCGAAISLPSSGQVAKCSYCGSEVTATSVLDKMKSVLA